MKAFIPDTSAFAGSSYFFYDLNAKFNYKLSDKDRIFLSGYYGKDVFTFSDTEGGSVQICLGVMELRLYVGIICLRISSL